MRLGMTPGTAAGEAWHVGRDLAARYADGTAAEPDAWSLEMHVEACGACAARVSAAVRAGGATTGTAGAAAGAAETPGPAAGAVLADVRAAVLATVLAEARAGTVRAESGAGLLTEPGSRVVVRPGTDVAAEPGTGPGTGVARRPAATRLARVLWAAGPALRGPWPLALVLVAVGAVVLAYGAGLGPAARPLLLVTAPVLPLAGVVVSYGRHADPLHEIAASTPSGGLWLLLTRTAAVLGLSIPALTCAGALLPASAGGPGAAAWLLPGLALTLAALALGSYVGCRAGASAVAVGWAAAVVLPSVGSASGAGADALVAVAGPYFAGPGVQGCWAAAALMCAALLAVRRRSFDHLETL
ncbi:zf-HC2 domain-containing protein [Streptomyces sp. NBC_00654]|uniref:zf-HC2 domain-containing protein n=1 Tax=Streptomyces sp. NBC_00654 TaxID=2975799 RepID=UPI0022533A06|nr:zf-HC2 domain-containing protein [Streptomyces sp. NBC_00654]MCX4964795.1 zf-HC2 domain-containing protein [Streptomyces sp. NBC_00654]